MKFAFAFRPLRPGRAALWTIFGLGMVGSITHAQDTRVVGSVAPTPQTVQALDSAGTATDHGYRIYRVPVARYDAGVAAQMLCRTGIAVVPPNYVMAGDHGGFVGNAGAGGGVLGMGNGANGTMPGNNSLGGAFGNSNGGFPGGNGFAPSGYNPPGFNPGGFNQSGISVPPGSQTIYNSAPISSLPPGGTTGAFPAGTAYPQANGVSSLTGSGGGPGAAGQETLPEGVRTIYAHEGNNSLVIEATPEAFARLMQRFRALDF